MATRQSQICALVFVAPTPSKRLVFSTMAKKTKIALIVIVVLVGALAAAFYAFNRSAVGIPAFYVWKAVSGKAHGGQYADINGIRIYYETYGTGRPVLVLQGDAAAIEAVHYQISALAASRFVIAPDSRAHGRSTDSNQPLSYDLMANDMLKLLDKLNIAEADVVGWSGGGIVGLALAMHHPERVKRLVVFGAPYDVDGVDLDRCPIVPADEEIAPMRDFYKRNAPDPNHWPVFFQKVAQMETQIHYSVTDLGAIKAPTLVMAGEFDCIKRQHTDQLAKAIPGATEEIIKGATHAAPILQPDVVNANILKFLK
jgi:pimeloyl-ACP methyl ester carboxylesterase